MDDNIQKLIILRGLPACGKSTWAKKHCELNPATVRVSRDDIRAMLVPNFTHGGNMEDLVTEIENHCIVEALHAKYSVIVDATNFRGVDRFYSLIPLENNTIEVEIRDFDVDLQTCIQRDEQRAKPVGKMVIENMYKKYLLKKEL